jgi:prepilin-type N-terminal cleavage/methylation domain-containing protein
MTTRSRAGFTLIELVVALLVVGMVLLLTHQVFTVVTEGARAIEASRTALDREANARRWLESAWLSLEVGGEAGGFEGHRTQAEFGTWLLTPGGWFTRARVRLDVADGDFVARTGGRTLVLADAVREVSFDYLLTPGAESHWVGEWISPASAPLAVRVRVRHADSRRERTDTLLFLIGPRG